MRRRTTVVALGICGIVAIGAGSARGAGQLMEAGYEALIAGDYGRAVEQLEAALAALADRPGEAARIERARCAHQLGLALFGQAGGRSEAAIRAFARSLREDPRQVLAPELTTPGLAAALETARRRVLGRLAVTSQPPGAEVFLFGKARGTTPCRLEGIPPEQPVVIELQMPGYATARETVRLGEGAEAPLHVELERPDRQPPSLEHEPPEKAVEGRPLALEARAIDDRPGLDVRLELLGTDGQLRTQALEPAAPDSFRGTVALPEGGPGVLAYAIVAEDRGGNKARFPPGSTFQHLWVERAATEPPELELAETPAAAAGQPAKVRVRARDRLRVDWVLLRYRTAGRADFAPVFMDPAGSDLFEAVVPGPAVAAPGVELVVAAGAAGGRRAQLGSPLAPLLVRVDSSDSQPPVLEHFRVASGRAGAPLQFWARASDDVGIERVLLFARPAGAAEYAALPLARGGGDSWTAILPGSQVQAPAMEYYLEARDGSGLAVTHSSPEQPHRIAVATSAPFSQAILTEISKSRRRGVLTVQDARAWRPRDRFLILHAPGEGTTAGLVEAGPRQRVVGAGAVLAPTSPTTVSIEIVDGREEVAEGDLVRLRTSPPAGLRGQALRRGRMVVSWEASHEPEVTGYRVYRSEEASARYLPLADLDDPGRTELEDDSGIEPGRTYYYRVSSVSPPHRESALSDPLPVTAKLQPLPPRSLAALSPADGLVQLAWELPADPEIEAIAIERREAGGEWAEIGRADPGATGFEDRGQRSRPLVAAGVYEYRAAAVEGSARSEWAAPATVIVFGPPRPPAELAARRGGPGQVVLIWSPSSAGQVLEYRLRRAGPDGGEFEALASLPGRESTLHVDGAGAAGPLAYGARYRYQVKTVDPAGIGGELSAVAEATTAPAPGMVTGLAATRARPGRIELAWQPPARDGLAGFRIERRDRPEAELVELARVADPDLAAFTDSGTARPLENGAEYAYRVAAIDELGTVGPPSAVATGSTRAAPPAPGPLQATTLEARRITLTWPSRWMPEIDRLVIYRRAPGEAVSHRIGRAALGVGQFHDTGLGDGETYIYEARYEDLAGLEGAPSPPETGSTRTAPPSPEGLAGVRLPDGSVHLSWTPVPGAGGVGYQVYQVRWFGPHYIGTTAEYEFGDPAPPAGEPVRYIVVAVDRDGVESPRSRLAELP